MVDFDRLERAAHIELIRLCGPSRYLPRLSACNHLRNRFGLSGPDVDMLLSKMECNGSLEVGNTRVRVIW